VDPSLICFEGFAMSADIINLQPFRLHARLPGPDRKRSEADYDYELLYRNPDPDAVGCVLTWEVRGGRLPYQIAVEREEAGRLRLHCTCADAVFRGALVGRFCKHVRGFLQSGQELQHGEPAAPARVSA
jgi:hypothetical protein